MGVPNPASPRHGKHGSPPAQAATAGDVTVLATEGAKTCHLRAVGTSSGTWTLRVAGTVFSATFRPGVTLS